MKKEVPRQTLHVLFGLVYLIILSFLGTYNAIIIIGMIFLIGLLTALSKNKKIIKLTDAILSKVSRAHEKFPGKAAIIFTFCTLLTIIIFDQKIAFGALIVLTFGDATASLIGKKIGKTKLIQGRSIEGTITGIIISFFILSFFFPIWIAFITAAIGMFGEFLPINDNLSVPLLAGITLLTLL